MRSRRTGSARVGAGSYPMDTVQSDLSLMLRRPTLEPSTHTAPDLSKSHLDNVVLAVLHEVATADDHRHRGAAGKAHAKKIAVEVDVGAEQHSYLRGAERLGPVPVEGAQCVRAGRGHDVHVWQRRRYESLDRPVQVLEAASALASPCGPANRSTTGQLRSGERRPPAPKILALGSARRTISPIVHRVMLLPLRAGPATAAYSPSYRARRATVRSLSLMPTGMSHGSPSKVAASPSSSNVTRSGRMPIDFAPLDAFRRRPDPR